MPSPLDPWHMWGDSEVFSLDASVFGTPAASHQLAKINYKRPETWHFAFLLNVQTMSAPTADYTLDVWIDLTLGVGRTIMQIPEFEHFRLFSAGGVGLSFPQLFWSTQVDSPNRIRSATAPLTNSNPGICDQIVAQDIQVRSRSLFLGSPGNRVTLEVTALFSPKTHVRPDWFNDGEQFRGNETGGS